jgi:hypothetical protein
MSLTKPNGAASRGFTRVAVMRKLLALGPLTFRETVAITGWPERSAESALVNLQIANEIETERVLGLKCRAHRYSLTNTARVRAFAEGA